MAHNVRRALLAVVLLAALLTAACGSRQNDASSGVLRVGTEGTYAPFSYQDPATGQLAGYDVDVANAVVEGVIITRADDNSITSVGDLKGKTAGATVTVPGPDSQSAVDRARLARNGLIRRVVAASDES